MLHKTHYEILFDLCEIHDIIPYFLNIEPENALGLTSAMILIFFGMI